MAVSLERLGLLAAVVALWLAPGVCPAAESATRRLPLAWATSEFLYVEGPRLRLQHRYAFGAAPAVWLEAEGGSALALEANASILDDATASGGRCLAYVDRLDFVVDVSEAGAYQSWTRCFFPFAASWNHTEGVDPADMRVVTDFTAADTDKAGRWVWLKGPVYLLEPGAWTYTFDGFHGGARLDKVLLTSDLELVPEGVGGWSPNIASHLTGRAETRDLRLGPVAEWLRLEGLPTVGVTAAVSLDGGASWQPLPAAGSLAGLPASPDPQTRLRVRLELTRTEREEPIVAGAHLVYVPADQTLWTVGNAFLRLGFDPASGSVAGLERAAAGRGWEPCLLTAEQQALFCLWVQQPDKPDTLVPLSSLDAEVTGHTLARHGRTLAMDFALLEGRLQVRCTVQADETPLTRWRLEVRNDSAATLYGIQFPLLSRLRLGDSAVDDVMVLPWWGPGSRTENPASAEWSPFRKLLNYPGSASMQWLDLYDLAGGLYVAAYDATHHDLELGYTQNRGESVNVTFRKACLVGPGRTWSGDYAVGVHPGDWHWAADRYREWAQTWQQAPSVPAWVADSDGWIMPSNCANLIGYPSMPLSYQVKGPPLGLSWMQCWMQMTETEHCCGQFHYPSPLWGTPEDFRCGIETVHDLGGRVGFYVNAQLFKPWHHREAANIGGVPTQLIPREVLETYDPQWASRWQARDFAGRPYDQPSADPYADGVRMNPAASGWQEHLVRWAADWYVGKFAADCVYFDQLSASGSLPVYDDARSDYGLWGRGYQQMLNRLLARAERLRPGFVLSMEGASDLHGQQVATALYGTDADLFDAYHYTFPEQILIDYGAYVNQGNKAFGSPKALYLNTFLMGTRFTEHPGDDFGRALFALRQRLKPLVYRATYRDTVGVTTSDAAVRAKRFVLDREGSRLVLVNLGNLERKAGVTVTADTAPLKRMAAAWLYGLDGSVAPLSYHAADGTAPAVAFDAPAAEAATAVFVDKVGPVVEAVAFPASAVRGSTVKGSATLRNLSDRRMTGKALLDLPRGWRAEGARFPALKPGQSAEVALAFDVPMAAARDLHDLFVVARGAGGEDRRYVSLAVVPAVQITATTVLDTGLLVSLRNRSARAISATCSLDPFEGVPAPAPQGVDLAPGAEVDVPFAVVWPDLTGSPVAQTARVTATAEGLSTTRSVAIGPTVVNGSFDGLVVNGDRPEGWPILHTRPDCMHLDTANPHDGRACLRIDPGPSSPTISQIATLQPGTTYRLTVAMRRADPADQAAFWVTLLETWSKSTDARLQFPAGDTSANEWRVFSTTFTTPPQLVSAWLYAGNANPSRHPVWFDAVEIVKVK